MNDQTLEARVEALERKERQTNLQDRVNGLRRDSYNAYAVSSDEKAAAQEKCPRCGTRRLTYRGLATFKPAFSYIAFFSCRKCGHWEEV